MTQDVTTPAAPPTLTQFNTFVYKSVPGGGLVPATGYATFHAQGATVSSASLTIPPFQQATASVYNTGALRPGPLYFVLWVNGDVGTPLEVWDVDVSLATVLLYNPTAEDITVLRGQRLILGNHPAAAYMAPTRDGPPLPASGAPIDPATGRVWVYVADFRYDYLVFVDDEPIRMFIDAVGSYVMRK